MRIIFSSKSSKVYLALSLVVFFVSCKRDIDDECPKCPRVTAVTPNAAHFDDTVLITGKYLLPNTNYNDVLQIKFNGNLIADEYVIANYEDSIRLIIPKGTPSGPVTVDINVTDELTSAGSANFTYLHKYTVSTFAGSGSQGNADSTDLLLAQFGNLRNFAINPVNNDLIVLDGGSTVRQASATSGVTTLISFTAIWSITYGITCDASGQVYVSTYGVSGDGCRIRKMVYQSGNWTFLDYAGVPGMCGYTDGNLTSATFNNTIWDILMDESNNMVIAENHNVRKITSSGTVTTMAGTGSVSGFMDGPASAALFSNVHAIDSDNNGNIYIADYDNHRIRKLSTAGIVSTIAGTGTQGYSNGPALTSQLTNPNGIALDNFGNLYFTDGPRHSIRKLNLNTSQVSVFAGAANGSEAGYADGDLSVARFNTPTKLAFDKNLNILYIIDQGNYVIRQITFE